MIGGTDKLGELAVGHWRHVNREGIDGHEVGRGLLAIMMIGPHAEGPAGHLDHVVVHDVLLRTCEGLRVACLQSGMGAKWHQAISAHVVFATSTVGSLS